MTSKELKKGIRFETFDGFSGKVMDNKRGVTRTVKLNGLFGVEMGSIYIDRIQLVMNPATGAWERLEYTEKESLQLKKIHSLGF